MISRYCAVLQKENFDWTRAQFKLVLQSNMYFSLSRNILVARPALACHSQLWLQLISKEQRACMIFLQHNFSTMILLQSWMQAKLSSNSCVILLGWLQFELTSHSPLSNYLMFWMTVHVAKWMSSENKTSLCHLLPSCWHFIKCQTQ